MPYMQGARECAPAPRVELVPCLGAAELEGHPQLSHGTQCFSLVGLIAARATVH